METTKQLQPQSNEHQDHGYDELFIKSLTLEGIAMELLKILYFVEDFEELPEGFEHKLNDLNIALEKKMYGIGKFLLHLREEIDYLKKREIELEAKRQIREKRYQKLEDYATTHMEELGQKSFDFKEFKLWIQKGNPSLVISDNANIPKQFYELDIKQKLNKLEIIKELKDGKEINGCHLYQPYHLRIG